MAIKATVGAEISSFERAMSRVEQKAKQTGASMKALGDSMSKLVTGPLVAIGAGLFGASVSAANFADEIDKASIRSGLSAQRLQELRFVTDQVGVSFETVESAVDSLRRRLPQLDNPGSRASETMERIGVSAHGANGELRSMDDLFPDIVRGLAAVTNETERGALATQILGRSASQLAPLLAQGEAGIAELTERAHELGLVMGDETIADLVDFKDEMAEVQQQIGASAREFGMVLMPILRNDVIPFFENQLIPAIRAVAERFQNMDESTRRNLLVWGGLIAGIGPFLSITGRLLSTMGPLITAFRTLTAVMLANPYVAVGAAVIALTARLFQLNSRLRDSREEVERLIGLDLEIADENDLEALQKGIVDITQRIQRMERANRGANGALNEGIAELNAQRDALIGNLQQVALKVREEQRLAAAVDNTTQTLDDNGEAIRTNTRDLIDLNNEYKDFVGTALDDDLDFEGIDFEFGEGNIDDITERMREGLGVSISEVNQALAELHDQYQKTVSEEQRAEIMATIEAFEEMHKVLTDNTEKQIYEFGLLDGAMANAIGQIDLFGDGFKNVGETAKKVFQQIINDLARMAAMRGFEVLLGISSGGSTSFFGGLFGGFRADGGPVNRGSAYVVGERGPEMFIPDTSGTIIPNGGSVNAGAVNMGGGVQRINLSGRFKVEGKDLVYVIDEYNKQVELA